jgi:hypothetical protein
MGFRFLLPLLFASLSLAQQPPARQHETHTHDGGFMQGDMHHEIAKGVTLDVKTDSASSNMTLRVGPMNLPANTSHMKMPQPADLIWSIPVTGWLLAYHPKLVDSAGNTVPGTVLHHVAFWNENRSDFLCPNKEEHIFGAGGELTDWTLIPGFGYRVEKGDRIRVETMIHNPTATSYEKVFLEISVPYLNDASPAPVRNFYPAWMDVAGCGSSSYDLPAGPGKKVGTVAIKYSGLLLGVGGHMHDYGQQLTLEISGPSVLKTGAAKPDASTPSAPESQGSSAGVPGSEKKKQVAVLPAKVDAQGHLLEMPVVTFYQSGGYPFAAGDTLTVTSTYNNLSGKLLRDGAMGIVVGYFVPQDPAALASLRHPGKGSSEGAHGHHDMTQMSPEH